MAVCERLECCVLAFMKRNFLWQCKDNLIASAVGIHGVNHRFWLWMIVRVVTVRAKLPASNPCVTNVLHNLGVLVNCFKSKPLCNSAAVSLFVLSCHLPPPPKLRNKIVLSIECEYSRRIAVVCPVSAVDGSALCRRHDKLSVHSSESTQFGKWCRVTSERTVVFACSH